MNGDFQLNANMAASASMDAGKWVTIYTRRNVIELHFWDTETENLPGIVSGCVRDRQIVSCKLDDLEALSWLNSGQIPDSHITGRGVVPTGSADVMSKCVCWRLQSFCQTVRLLQFRPSCDNNCDYKCYVSFSG